MLFYGPDARMIASVFSGLFRTIGTFGTIIQIACYVLGSLALYTIAKRRGIRNYGLAWVPVINVWILGSISDQYKYVTAGKVQSRRKVLLWLSILMACFTVIAVAVMASAFVGYGMVGGFGTALSGLIGSALLIAIAFLVISIIYTVYYFIALYNVYMSCMPGCATLFLVLSIFFSVTTPFFLFACREKDDGMPPRHAQETEQIPTYTEPKEPWDN